MRIAALDIRDRPARNSWAEPYSPGDEESLAGPSAAGTGGLPPGRPAEGMVNAAGERPHTDFSPAIAVYDRLDPIEAVWRSLQERSQSTIYQNFLWCRTWLETTGKAIGIRPRIVVATDEAGRTAFILPLQLRRRFGILVLEWLGAPLITYGGALLSTDFLDRNPGWLDRHWTGLLHRAGPADLVSLQDIPSHLLGRSNPLHGMCNIAAANRGYGMNLSDNFDTLHARKRPGEARRALRKKEEHLQARGRVTFGLPASKAEAHMVLDRMFDDQEKRLAEAGVHHVFGPAERRFIHCLVDNQDDDAPLLLPYHLRCGDEILAVMMGGQHGGAFWALISSLTPGEARKYSPGEMALVKTIEACCRRGLAWLDFATGDTRYKMWWMDEKLNLGSHVAAPTLRGLPFAFALAARIAVKRRIKENRTLFELAKAVRRVLRGRPTEP